MFATKQDIIFAQATPPGRSALSIIRISGQNLSEVIYSITKRNKLNPRYATLLNIYNPGSDEILDSCVVIYYKSPRSFTGEDMLEINCHGSPAITRKIMKALISINLRAAKRGEFSFRAFINKKIDLTQAEAINELINTDFAQKTGASIENLGGRLSKKVWEIKESLVALLVIIEHELDFNDNEIKETPIKQIIKILNDNINLILNIQRNTTLAQKAKEGYRVVLFGKPNVGKSLLYNYVIDQEKSIVSDVAGTTRDYNEQYIEFNQTEICLVDTAGYFKTNNKIDQQGIDKTLEQIKRADILIIVDDKNPQLPAFVKPKTPYVLVNNKSDLKTNLKDSTAIHTSALTGYGINLLLTKLSTKIQALQSTRPKESLVLSSARQQKILSSILRDLKFIKKEVEAGAQMDVVASLSRAAINQLEEFSGKIYSEDIIANIFDGFCIGK